jgi:hypothetical protein
MWLDASKNVTSPTAADFRAAIEVNAATTIAAGLVELATNAEAIAGADTQRAVTPSGAKALVEQMMFAGYLRSIRFGSNAWAAQTNVGTGSTIRTDLLIRASTGTTAESSAMAYTTNAFPPTVNPLSTNPNWSRPTLISMVVGNTNATATPNGVGRVYVGKSGTTYGDLTRRGVGIIIEGNSTNAVIKLQVHNGTTLTTTAGVSVTYPLGIVPILIYSDGTGNVSVWYNPSESALGTPTLTTTAGPTGTEEAGANRISVEAYNGPDAAAHILDLHEMRIYVK